MDKDLIKGNLMNSNNGLFIMIDGIAGSGKSTLTRAIHRRLLEQGLSCFRLEDWKESQPPSFEQIQNFDVFFTFEPTKQWAGAMIRYGMSPRPDVFDAEAFAHAFALDRQVMYDRLIIPAKEAGKIIIQDRGVTTSLAYQTTMRHALSFDEIRSLPGNHLALQHVPEVLILTELPIEEAAARIANRSDDHKGVFQDLDLLRRVAENFKSDEFRSLFEAAGTKILELNTSGNQAETEARTLALVADILPLS